MSHKTLHMLNIFVRYNFELVLRTKLCIIIFIIQYGPLFSLWKYLRKY